MVNKRGFMRVVEATIAVLIILGALFVISSQRNFEERQDLSGILRSLLDEMAKNQELREKIIDYDLAKCEPPNQIRCRSESPNKEILANVSSFLEERIKNPAFSYYVNICRADKSCPLEPFPADDPGDIYAAERIITTTLSQEITPEIRKVKIFLWRRV